MEDNRLIQERVRKLNELKERGVNPYPHIFKPSKRSETIKSEHEGLKPEEQSEVVESVAGRIMLLRNMGKAAFITLADDEGKIQLYLRKDDVGADEYKLLKKLDIGDFIGVTGKVFKTRTGEVTIYAESFIILSKAIRPLPEKFHGIQDTELKYRKRHLDLIMNQESKQIFVQRLNMMKAIREYMNELGFLEVETPALQTQYGGAAAKPFMTHHNDLDIDMYLRVSPELYLKRLIVGGFEKVYDINKNFRNEGIDTTHNPEFTMLECYQAYADYNDMMELMEGMYDYVAQKVLGTTKIMFKGVEVDVAKPWPRIKMLDAIKEHAGIDADTASVDELHQFIIDNKVEFKKEKNWGNMVGAIFEHYCEDKYINPTFIIDHPKESTPLCKGMRDGGDERLIERFEPFAMGMELGNAYSELNDPIKQRELLVDQQRQLDSGNGEANPLDEDFLDAIETGMPPTGGLGIGIDRMIMLLTGQESIRDILFFPTMKPAPKSLGPIPAKLTKCFEKLQPSHDSTDVSDVDFLRNSFGKLFSVFEKEVPKNTWDAISTKSQNELKAYSYLKSYLISGDENSAFHSEYELMTSVDDFKEFADLTNLDRTSYVQLYNFLGAICQEYAVKK